MDEQIARLRAQRARLMARVQRIDNTIKVLENLDAELADLLTDEITETVTPNIRHRENPAASEDASASRKRGPNGSSPKEIADAAIRVLYKQGRALTRFELIPLIEAEGLTIGGVDKPRNMGTILWRDGRFKNTGEGYWPHETEDGGPPPDPGDMFDSD